MSAPAVASDGRTITVSIAGAVAAYMGTSPSIPVYVMSTDGWITPASDTSDGLHPNSTGFAKIAALEGPVFAGYLSNATTAISLGPIRLDGGAKVQ